MTLDDLFGEMNYEGIEKRNVLNMAAGVNNDKREAKHRPVVKKCMEEARRMLHLSREHTLPAMLCKSDRDKK